MCGFASGWTTAVYALHHERIGELGVELAAIADALARDFVLREGRDDDDLTPTDESARAYFAHRARR